MKVARSGRGKVRPAPLWASHGLSIVALVGLLIPVGFSVPFEAAYASKGEAPRQDCFLAALPGVTAAVASRQGSHEPSVGTCPTRLELPPERGLLRKDRTGLDTILKLHLIARTLFEKYHAFRKSLEVP